MDPAAAAELGTRLERACRELDDLVDVTRGRRPDAVVPGELLHRTNLLIGEAVALLTGDARVRELMTMAERSTDLDAGRPTLARDLLVSAGLAHRALSAHR